jgi:hypothetical protein
MRQQAPCISDTPPQLWPQAKLPHWCLETVRTSERLLRALQRPLIHRLGLIEPALVCVEEAQVVDRTGSIRFLWPS